MNKEINDYFISILRKQVRIQDFENWLYNNDVFLEEILGEQTYFKLINLNYSSKFVIDEIEPLIIKILDYRSIEDFKIRDLLSSGELSQADTSIPLR